MSLVLVGLSHRTAPVEVRERVEVSAEALPDALEAVRRAPGVREVALVSTCNRVEVLALSESPEAAGEAVTDWLADRAGMGRPAFARHVYVHRDEEALRHLFRVASSLDSLVIGEPQILHQVKSGFQAAAERGAASGFLHRVWVKTAHVASRVRNETGIARAAVSISYAAAELARRIFDRLDDKAVLVVGAGEMGLLALRHLVDRGVGRVLVSNRTLQRAEEAAAGFGGRALDLAGIPGVLHEVDIVISCTGAAQYLVTRDAVQAAMKKRRGRSMFLIDISVPRNIDPAASRLDNVYVYDIDDLQAVVDRNLGERRREAEAADRIVDDEVERWRRTLGGVRATPLVRALVRNADRAREIEVARTLDRFQDLPEPQRERLRGALEAMTAALARRILHHPIQGIKEIGATGDADGLEEIGRLFGIDGPMVEVPPAESEAGSPPRPAESEGPPRETQTTAAAPSERRAVRDGT